MDRDLDAREEQEKETKMEDGRKNRIRDKGMGSGGREVREA